jgi:hypothetical protein
VIEDVTKKSLILLAAGSVPALYFGLSSVLGIWIAGAACWLSFVFISKSWRKTATFASAFANYVLRFLFYGIVIGLSLKEGIPVLSLLAGVSLQKLSVFWAGMSGKGGEDDND